MADDLSNISFDEGKAGAVKDFVSVLSDNIDIISAITGEDADGAKAWLEGIAKSANELDEGDAKGWADLINAIKEGLPGIENTDFGQSFFSAIGGEMGGVEQQASVLEWAVSALGDKTTKTAQQQEMWLEVCRRLVKTIPGLSSIINTETGEVKGGTEAIKDYIKAWEDGQTKLALLGAVEKKEAAYTERFSNLPELELDMALEKRRAKKALEELKEVYAQYGAQVGLDGNGKVLRDFSSIYGLDEEGRKALNAVADAFDEQYAKANKATEEYNKQKEALEEAKVALQEYRQAIEDEYGSLDAAKEAGVEWSEEMVEAAKTVSEAAQTALTDLADYVQGVRDATEKAVDSTVKGFEKIETPMDKAREKTKDLTEKLTKLGKRTKDNAKEWDKLNEEINQNNSGVVTANRMAANLKQQAEFMDNYLANLRKARELGVSDEILAELSDGSAESADYLAALASAAPSEVEAINQSYQSVIDKKKELTDELTGQQLSVDDTYKSLAEKAKESVAALDLEGEAANNAGKTVAGIAQGISAHVPEVQSAVDAICDQLNRLNGWGINIDLGQFGSFPISSKVSPLTHKPTNANYVQGFETGLDFVPRDDFLARLHEGEAVLTAEENKVWQGLKYGGGVDYDAIGGVMRDNIRPGGDVYLDGRIVGNVISDRQGRNYKSLQRSGWQS